MQNVRRNAATYNWLNIANLWQVYQATSYPMATSSRASEITCEYMYSIGKLLVD